MSYVFRAHRGAALQDDLPVSFLQLVVRLMMRQPALFDRKAAARGHSGAGALQLAAASELQCSLGGSATPRLLALLPGLAQRHGPSCLPEVRSHSNPAHIQVALWPCLKHIELCAE